MRITFITIISLLLTVTTTKADNGKAASDGADTKVARQVEYNIHAVDLSEITYPFTSKKDADLRKAKKAGSKTENTTLRLLTQKELAKFAKDAKKERLDSVMGKKELDGVESKLSRQDFTYDKNGYPVKRINSLYDETTDSYFPVENYTFAWNDKGLCTSQEAWSDVYNSGERKDYKYNDQNLGIEQTVYQYDPSTDEKWVPSWKGEYKYDGRGNMIEEVVSYWNSDDNKFVLTTKNVAAYNEQGLMSLFEPYSWNGTEWIGRDERKEYTYLNYNHITKVNTSIWDENTRSWFWYCNFEQDFDKWMNMTRQEKKFYNKTRKDWSGCEDYGWGTLYNVKTDITFDDKGRELTARVYDGKTTDGYTLSAGGDYKWTDNADGSSTEEGQSWLIKDEGDEKFVNYELTEKFDAAGNRTYLLEKTYNYQLSTLLKDYERDWAFNDRNEIINEHTYNYNSDAENKRKPSLAVYYTYDNFGNLTETINQTGPSGAGKPLGAPSYAETTDGEDEWVNSTRFLYGYTQDTVRVSKEKYKWQDGAWTLNEKSTTTYDFNVPLSDIIVWVGFNSYHKIAQTTSAITLQGVMTNNIFDYFYTDLTTTGMTSAHTDGSDIRIFPTIVTDGFTVSAPAGTRTDVYSTGGIRVISTTENNVSTSNLPAGVYIVKAGIKTARIIKR